MLVEDDKSLREIYGERLQAEGYEIKSAGDGEEALAMAVKERPDLIISDVMMPKISGFDMLDILRSTPETKYIKVIMMTALSSEDQRARGESLGADRYLVKSQVGIEDVVRTIHDVLGDIPNAAAPSTTAAIDTDNIAQATSTIPDSSAQDGSIAPSVAPSLVEPEPPATPVTPVPQSTPSNDSVASPAPNLAANYAPDPVQPMATPTPNIASLLQDDARPEPTVTSMPDEQPDIAAAATQNLATSPDAPSPTPVINAPIEPLLAVPEPQPAPDTTYVATEPEAAPLAPQNPISSLVPTIVQPTPTVSEQPAMPEQPAVNLGGPVPAPQVGERVIEPINADINTESDMSKLMSQELSSTTPTPQSDNTTVPPSEPFVNQ
jgi:CheY-like chemotaxis protein